MTPFFGQPMWQQSQYCNHLGLVSNPLFMQQPNSWGANCAMFNKGSSNSLYSTLMQLQSFKFSQRQYQINLLQNDLARGYYEPRDFSKFETSSTFNFGPNSGSSRKNKPLNKYLNKSGDFAQIVLDFGHGGKDSGAVNGSHKEADLIRLVGNDLLEELADRGINAVTTEDIVSSKKTSSQSVGLRKDFRDDYSDVPFLSLHMNSSKDKKVKGVETFYSSGDKNDKAFARKIQGSLSDIYSDRKVRPDTQSGVKRIGVLRDEASEQACALVELGYLSNAEDLSKITNSKKRKEIVQAIADAIESQVAEST